MRRHLLFILLLSFALSAYGQSSVTGKVTDDQGDPLPGVNVLVQGTSQGTITDADGNYQVSAPGDGVLVFSFIGYVTEQVNVNNRSVLDVQMLPSITALQEVVVVGYGASTKKELTGAVSALDESKIQAINPQRLEQALQGQVAGVDISSASGSPGGQLNIRIRGLSTDGENAPLILVDGTPYSHEGLNALSPADIESISILKDATAGIYGVRAANGVIYITTKKGKLNAAPSLTFEGYYGVQETSTRLDVLNAREFAILKNETFAAGGLQPPFNNVNLGEGVDWQEEVFQRAPVQSYHLAVSGGTDKTTYSIGGSFLDQQGIVGGDKSGFRRYNGRLNVGLELAPRVRLENALLYSNENRRTLPENEISSVLFNALNASPASSVRDADGDFTYLEEVNDLINPVAQIHNSFNDAFTNKVTGSHDLVYEITKGLSATGRAGYNYAIVDFKQFTPLVFYGTGKPQNTALNENLDPNETEIAPGVTIPIYNNVTETRSTYFDYNLETFLNFDRTFGEKHQVKGTLGLSLIERRNQEVSGTAYNIPYNSYDFADISAADGNNLLNNTTSTQLRSRLQSYFLRAEYNFDSKYLFSAIIRRDGSTNFGKNNRFGYFPAASAAWVLSEESFFPFSFVGFAKLRASYGISGNDQIPAYVYRGLLNGEAVYPFDDQLIPGVAVGTLGNPDLKWEQTHQANFGVDLVLLNDRVDLSADYYIKTTHDLLSQPDVSGVLGSYGAAGNPPVINSGDVRNSGFEFLIAYSTPANRDFGLNVSYNLATIKNEVTGLPQGVEFREGGAFGVGGETATRMEVGYPIGYFFGYETDGVFQTAEEITESAVQQEGASPGDFKFKDQNGDNVINFSDDSDKTFIGSPIPDVTMGLSLGANFKGFDFSALIYSALGHEILRNYERQQPLANLLAYRIDRWTGAGSTNEHPRLTVEGNRNSVISDYFVEDASFVRLKNVQLGYTLPSQLTERIGAGNLRVYVSANNLLTLTKYMGYDPDFSSGDPLASRIDYGFYPQATTYSAGLNLKF